eukprot:EST47157.1 Hypothetical protein SS50377_12668 [Spironucleus salmonicida]
MKSRDTKTELSLFIENKQQFEKNSLKQKYFDYMKKKFPDYQRIEKILSNQLCIEQPLVDNPSLSSFFQLFVEEQQLQIGLAQLYANLDQKSELLITLSQVQEDPKQIFFPPRVLSNNEYDIYQQRLKALQQQATLIQFQCSNLINNLPISTATFSLFDKLESNRKPPQNIQENFQLQVSSIIPDKSFIKIFSIAFKIPEANLTANFNAFADKKRQNNEIQHLMNAIQSAIINILEMFENYIPDEQIIYEDNSDKLKQKLANQNHIFSAKPIIPKKQEIIHKNNQPKSLNTDIFLFQAQKQAEKEYQQALDTLSTRTKADPSTIIFNQKITQLRKLKTDFETGQKKQISQERLKLMQNRILAAEKDAEKVRPKVEFDEEKLLQLSKNQVSRLKENENRKQLQNGLIFDGEFKGYNQFSAGKDDSKESFVAMNLLAERGLLGTEAASQALRELRGREVQQRFGGMLRDDVGKLFG